MAVPLETLDALLLGHPDGETVAPEIQRLTSHRFLAVTGRLLNAETSRTVLDFLDFGNGLL
jgi:hypothetical protein